MFLAINEIRYAKTRYLLIVSVVVLISLLVYFLTGLAYGLAWSNRTVVDSWKASGIVLSDSANKNLMVSTFDQSLASSVKEQEKASLYALQTVVFKNGIDTESQKINVSFFGSDKSSFIYPKIIEGRDSNSDTEVIASVSLKKESNLEIGDTVQIAGNRVAYKIVGFTENLKFNTAPVLFTSIKVAREIRGNMMVGRNAGKSDLISAVVVRGVKTGGNVDGLNKDLKYYEIEDFVMSIPGYKAQLLTFGIMIGFLVLIAALVIGIFMYVLTVEKKSVFGVMKAQGVSTFYISKSVILQTVILTSLGLIIGLGLTIITSLLIPPVVPFLNNWIFYSLIFILLIIMSVAGTLFSVLIISKIDPLKAIG